MVAIQLRFTAGRFHATPWGRHVNEGAVEWPPSPWRLLRALLAMWHRKCGHLPEHTVRSLVERLTTLPEFHLPPAAVGHTRHYMPKYRPGETDMVFDTFATVSRDTPLVIVWQDLTLEDAESNALRELLSSLSYFGRAETWVEATYRDDWRGEVNCRLAGEGPDDAGLERVPVIAAVSPGEYEAWRDSERERLRQRSLAEKRAKATAKQKDPAGVKLTAADERKVKEYVPDHLFAALHAETTTLRKQGWSHPPGARTVHYLRPREALEARPQRKRRTSTLRPTVARYAIHADVLPSLTEALSVGELMRRALMSRSSAAPVFAGKDEDGEPLTGHQHAYILPADDDDDGRLDHIVVYCQGGFDAEARRTLGRVKRLWQGAEQPELGLLLTSLGDPRSLGGTRRERDETPLLATSRVWESRTPFVLVRHPKRCRDGTPKLHGDGTWIDGPEDQVRRELAARGLPELERIDPWPHTEARGHALRWLHFRRHRKAGHGRQGPPGAFGFRLTFAGPVTGPVALGYGAHFGLGQFLPIRTG